MRKYLIEGRIVPERVDFNAPPLTYNFDLNGGQKFDATINIIKSKIFIYVDAPDEVPIPEIRNVIYSALGDLVNFAGFQLVIGISYELDSITNVDNKSTTVFGAEGFVFDDLTEFDSRITFRSGQFGAPTPISVPLLSNRAIARATFELRCSIRYPDFTALHCRLAIEAIRNAFNHENEAGGWKLLRDNLKINRATIESFKDVATTQRHGRNTYQTWVERRRCMQIAWEIVHRYTIYVSSTPPKALDTAPEL